MSAATDLRLRLGKAWIKAQREVERLTYRAKIAQPRLLGPAIRGPLVQLYRCDRDFATEVSFVNYLSFYLPGEELGIAYTLTAYDREGRKLGSGRHRIRSHQGVQRSLAELTGARLDAHGLYTVEADYDPDIVERIAFLGQTAPQFMTLFVPAGASAAAPQILHSHKGFQKGAVPYSPCRWDSPSTERLAAVDEYSIFIINACGSRLSGRVELADEGGAAWRASYEVPRWGVSRIDMAPAALGLPTDRALRFACDFDRRTPHRKPILFRRFADGSVTGNHS